MKRRPAQISNSTISDLTPADLPEGWVMATILDLLEIKYGKGLKGETRKSGKVAVYGSNGIVGEHDTAITGGPTIIVGRKGTVGAVHWSSRPCWPIDTTYYVDDFGGLHGLFIYYAFRTLGLPELDTSSAIPGLNRDDMYKQLLPLPPLSEQKRIVAKVEELLARVNAARERLSKVPVILKRFRQSVLAAACSGRLTEDWRAANPSPKISNPPISNPPKDPELPEIPATWQSVTLNELLDRQRSAAYGVLQPGSDYPNGVPMVRVCDILGGRVLVENLKRIAPSIDAHYQRTRLQGREVLVTLVGTIGRTAVVPQSAVGANVARAVGVFPIRNDVLSQYVSCALSEPTKNNELIELAREVARKTLNLGILKEVEIPLPSLPEQHEIVRRVERLFALADSIEKRVAAGTARAEKLTQAILAKAFRGELVPTEASLKSAV